MLYLVGQFTSHLCLLLEMKLVSFTAREVLRILWEKVLFYSVEYGRIAVANGQGLFTPASSNIL